jgi:hypothetical protein
VRYRDLEETIGLWYIVQRHDLLHGCTVIRYCSDKFMFGVPDIR